MAENNNQQTIYVEDKALETSVKSIARCAKINTAITIGLTAAAVTAYAAFALAIKKIANN